MSRPDQPLWVGLDWIERHCVVPDGFRKGAPFRLYRYQGEYLAAFYTVRGVTEWDPRNPILAPAFRYRRGLLVAPQKVGKNPLIAAQICLEFVGPALFAGWAGQDEGYVCAEHGCRCGWEYPYDPGEPRGMPWPTPKIQITAFSEDSTENTYDALRPMISEGPLRDVLPKAGEEFIRHPNGAEDSRIDTVTSSNQSRLGQRVTFVPQDELGLWTRINKMEKLADTQYRGLAGMGGRASLTTNAWDPAEHSVAQREYESAATDVWRQFVQPPRNLSYGDKRERHRIHLAVYPDDTLRENGGHIDLASIEGEAADLAEKDSPQAERFFGNRLVARAGAAVEPEQWDAIARPTDVPQGAYIGAGFDGSINEDETWLRGCTQEGYRFTIKRWVKPEGSALLDWQRANPGKRWTVPRLDVAATVGWMFGYYSVGRMLCDPFKWWTEVETWQAQFGLDAEGKDRVLPLETNQERKYAPVVDRWRTSIREGRQFHDGDPACRDHVLAARLKKARTSDPDADGRTRHVIVKSEDGKRIDGAVADSLALEAAMTMPADAPRPFRSNYEDERLTFSGAVRTT